MIRLMAFYVDAAGLALYKDHSCHETGGFSGFAVDKSSDL